MCKVVKVCDISTVMCGNEKGHPPSRHYVSCILIFDYHFCLPFLLVWMVVMWCSSWVPPNAFCQNFEEFSFESGTRFENGSPNYHSSNINVLGRLFQLWPVILSSTNFTTFLEKSPYIHMLSIYIYMPEKKNTFSKKTGRNGKNGRNAQLSHQLSYHFYWFHRISTTLTKTWRSRMAIYWHTSPKAYTPIYSEYRSCLYQKMLDWCSSPCIHP